VLFTDERFAGLTCEAKVLYGLMLDRMSLSVRNGWLDEDGKVYIIFPIEEIRETEKRIKSRQTKMKHLILRRQKAKKLTNRIPKKKLRRKIKIPERPAPVGRPVPKSLRPLKRRTEFLPDLFRREQTAEPLFQCRKRRTYRRSTMPNLET
jgi:hypothetical protein